MRVLLLRAFLCLLLPALASAQPWRTGGRPPVRLFSRFDYKAASGNWALAEGPAGIIWVGNNLGVLEFDGADWRLIQLPNGSAVRSLAPATEERCYVGGQDEFGYLEADATGTRKYRSLAAELLEGERGFGDVWSVHVLEGAAWFKTTSGLFVWRQNRLESIKLASTTGGAVLHEGRLHVFSPEKGLVAVSVPGQTSVVTGSDLLLAQKALIRGAWSLGEGVTVLATEAHGLWRWTSAGVAPWPVPPEEWLRTQRLYSGTRLRDGRLALGTVRGGLALVGADGNWEERIGKAQGLPDFPILAALEDRRGGLWLALENGLARLDLRLPVRSFNDADGVRGVVNDSINFAGRRYAATSLGLVRLRPASSPAEDVVFESLPAVAKEIWSLIEVEGDLLICTADGVWCLGSQPGAEPRQLTDTYTYYARASVRQKGLVYIALRQGVGALQRASDGTWKVLPPMQGTKDEVWSLLEAGDGTLWAGTPYRGIWRAPMPEGYRADAPVQVFGESKGVPDGSPAMIASIDRRIVAATDFGLLRFDETSGKFALWEEPGVPRGSINGMAGEPTGETTYLEREKGGRFGLWRWPAPTGGARAPAYRVREFSPYARFECWELTQEPDRTVWVGGSEGLLRLRAVPPAAKTAGPEVLLRRWETGGQLRHGGAPETSIGRDDLPFADRRMRFAVGATAFTPEWGGPAVRFRWKLDGLDGEWSPWSETFSREYTGLAEGTYRLHVEAQDAFGDIGPEFVHDFRLLPPWQRTPLAYALWLALGVGLVALLVAWRLARQREVLLQAQRARERLLRAETLARDAQLSALRYQINPHFLFNALNAVRARIADAPETARGMINHLAGYFRRTLESGLDAAMTTVAGEVAALEDYLALERARFGERLEVRMECDPAVADHPLPALLLQPLLENAIKYGAATTPEDEVLRITLRLSPRPDGGLELVLHNTGSWIEPGQAAPAESTGTGLANVRERLAQWRPEAHELSAGPAECGGVEVRLVLPRP